MSLPRLTFVIALVVAAIIVVTAMSLRPTKQSPLDPALWDAYQAAFIRDGRVIDRDNRGISHSEGQGYGMIFAEAFGDRAVFDALYAWTRNNLMREDGLLSWRWEQGSGITDANNATDGDILVAWALLRAAERWDAPEYAQDAMALLSAIEEYALVDVAGRRFILPGVEGFERPQGPILNPSYWVYPALDDFAKMEEGSVWSDIAASGEWLTQQAGLSASGLALDWVQLTPEGVTAAPDFPERFSWDAVRIPLYIAWGDNRRYGLLGPYQRFWENQFAQGDLPAWIDLSTGQVAPYPAPVGIRVIANIVTGRAFDYEADIRVDESYFSSSLLILSVLATTASTGRIEQ